MVFLSTKGHNSIVIIAGANLELSVENLRQPAAENLLKNAKVALFQLEIRPEVTLEALKMAKTFSGKVVLLSSSYVSYSVLTYYGWFFIVLCISYKWHFLS